MFHGRIVNYKSVIDRSSERTIGSVIRVEMQLDDGEDNIASYLNKPFDLEIFAVNGRHDIES